MGKLHISKTEGAKFLFYEQCNSKAVPSATFPHTEDKL